jgi:hypothetical protein
MTSTIILLATLWLVVVVVVVVGKSAHERFTNDKYRDKMLETSVGKNLEQHAYIKYLESKPIAHTDCHHLAQQTCKFTNPYMFMPSKRNRDGESCIVNTQEKIKHTYLPCYNYVLDCCRERNC